MYQAKVKILPHKELLDPQGKAVMLGLHNLLIQDIADVRVGKYITLDIAADTEERAYALAKEACDKLLHNKIMEQYELSVEKK